MNVNFDEYIEYDLEEYIVYDLEKQEQDNANEKTPLLVNDGTGSLNSLFDTFMAVFIGLCLLFTIIFNLVLIVMVAWNFFSWK